jgi:hypothetical protein
MPTEPCRYGHCTRLHRFCPTCVGDQFDLCGRSKATASFVLAAAALTALAVYRGVAQPLLGRGGAAAAPASAAALLPLHVAASLCALVGWAVWARWVQLVNDDAGGRAGNVVVSELVRGSGFALCLVGFSCSALLSILFFFARRAEHAAAAHLSSGAAARAARENIYGARARDGAGLEPIEDIVAKDPAGGAAGPPPQTTETSA